MLNSRRPYQMLGFRRRWLASNRSLIVKRMMEGRRIRRWRSPTIIMIDPLTQSRAVVLYIHRWKCFQSADVNSDVTSYRIHIRNQFMLSQTCGSKPISPAVQRRDRNDRARLYSISCRDGAKKNGGQYKHMASACSSVLKFQMHGNAIYDHKQNEHWCKTF